MSYIIQKYSWNGNEALSMAAHMITELNGINDLDVKNWLDYDDINWIEKSARPYRKTLLHDYISFVNYLHHKYLIDKHFPMATINTLVEVLNNYKVDYAHIGEEDFIGLSDEDLQSDGYDFSSVEAYGYKLLEFFNEKLGEIITDDIFTVLFSNKEFLFGFNNQLKDLVSELNREEYPEYLKKDGIFKRRGYIPVWLKNGVYMRDKGRCQICGTDLTRIITLEKSANYDHIIPLELGGTNDPTNFQLTCENCNKSKGARNSSYNSLGARFWDMKDNE